jgi:hypothetical protein
VDDQPLALDPGRAREPELAERRDIGADPLLGEQAQDGDVGERLRSVEDERIRHRRQDLTRLRADRLLAVRDERRPEALCELGGAHASDAELAALDARRVRKKLQHEAIVPVTL